MTILLRQNRLRLVAGAIAALVLVALPLDAQAQSVIDRLSGFDEARMASVAHWIEQPDDLSLAREAAKLLYQVNRTLRGGELESELDTTGASSSRSTDPLSIAAGHLVSIRGQVTAIRAWQLPDPLSDVLEFEVVYRVEVVESGSARPVVVITSEIPIAWIALDGPQGSGRETSATGVRLRAASDAHPAVMAAPALTWLANSRSGVSADWALLGEHGFDVSVLEDVRSRDRQPLRSEDSDAFYPLLKVAAAIGSAGNVKLSDGRVVVPSQEPAVDLLKDSASMVGRFIRLDVHTVRVMRVAVTQSRTKAQLGSDHYWQIDAIGDLGNVIIRIESEGGKAANFENRYPISIATRELPPFFKPLLTAGNATEADSTDMAMVSTSIGVDGYFYRLWSYESEYMARHGGGNQFGPLVIASRIIDMEPKRGDADSVSRIGWFVAALTVGAILTTIITGTITSRRDAAAKRRQLAKLPERILD